MQLLGYLANYYASKEIKPIPWGKLFCPFCDICAEFYRKADVEEEGSRC